MAESVEAGTELNGPRTWGSVPVKSNVIAEPRTRTVTAIFTRRSSSTPSLSRQSSKRYSPSGIDSISRRVSVSARVSSSSM